MLSLQRHLQQESVLAVNLTCPLSKKTECFNKLCPLTRLSPRGTNFPLSFGPNLIWEIHCSAQADGDRTVNLEQARFNEANLSSVNAGEETNGAATDGTWTKEWLTAQSAAKTLSLFDGGVISHKHALPAAVELLREPKTQI